MNGPEERMGDERRDRETIKTRKAVGTHEVMETREGLGPLGGFASSEVPVWEEELTTALARVEAPQGFAERVIARAVAEQGGGRVLAWPVRARRWVGGAAAAGVVFGLFTGGVRWEQGRGRQVERERRAVAATAEFATAERITDRALAPVREHMARVAVRVQE